MEGGKTSFLGDANYTEWLTELVLAKVLWGEELSVYLCEKLRVRGEEV